MGTAKTDIERKEKTAQGLPQSLGIAAAIALTITLAGCGGGGGGGEPSGDSDIDTVVDTLGDAASDNLVNDFPPQYLTPVGVTECSTADINMRVDFDMRDYYIFYDQVPNLNLADYETPEALIRDLRVEPDTFSFVTDAQELSDLVDNGLSGGFGFVLRFTDNGDVRAREILLGSPADDAGMLRGDLLLAIDGIPFENLSEEQIDFAFDPFNAPINMTIRTGDEAPRDVSVDFADFTWRTAGPAVRFPLEGAATVGYLPIAQFLETTEAEINRSLDFLRSGDGFDELVVDLRYNPGGRTSVTRHLASVVAGEAVEDEVFLLRTWNDKYSANNSVDFFDTVESPLNLPRVYVLVTEFSSSASEVFINALKPYMEVIVIGGVTSGKPFTSSTRTYCGKAINAMFSVRTNALGVSVAGGIQPDCRVEDRWETTADSVFDPLLNGAFGMIDRNTCPAPVLASVPAKQFKGEGFSYSDPRITVPGE